MGQCLLLVFNVAETSLEYGNNSSDSRSWSMGITLLILEVENKSVVELIKAVERQRYWNVVSPTDQLMARQWKVEMCHTYREGNPRADHLAGLALERPLGEPPKKPKVIP